MYNLSPIKIKFVSFAKKVFGENRIQSLINQRYIATYKKHGIIFIHIPKAAGTSVSFSLYGKRNGHLKAAYLTEKMDGLFFSLYSFSVTRNPYERLISAYEFARKGQTKEGAIANCQLYNDDEFETFGSFVKNWLIHQDLNNLDPVFQPQHTFVFKDSTCLVSELFKLESLGELEKRLSRRLSRRIEFAKRNTTNFGRNRNDYYTDDLRNIVYNLYKADFDLLGYEK